MWFDLDSASLIELPQSYERRGEASYWYEAPTVPYQALLEIAPNGFVQSYPGTLAAGDVRRQYPCLRPKLVRYSFLYDQVVEILSLEGDRSAKKTSKVGASKTSKAARP